MRQPTNNVNAIIKTFDPKFMRHPDCNKKMREKLSLISFKLNTLCPHIEQHQFDALVSLLFANNDLDQKKNLEVFVDSDLLEYLKRGMINMAAAEFGKYVFTHKRINPKLVNRRRVEELLFLTGSLNLKA